MPPFKDEHILLIVPGSQTTLAQLGLPESFTPARFRFPSRMFPAEKKGEWEPHKVRERVITVRKPAPIDVETTTDSAKATEKENPPAPTSGEDSKQDVEMKDDPTTDGDEAVDKTKEKVPEVEEKRTVYEEDLSSDEGAVYPIRDGDIVDWGCFFALLTHVYNTLSPPFHTPIMLLAEPAWTWREKERITQFVFEKFKTPAFCMMDSALAVCYAYGTPSATIVDIGHGKADVTAITDFVVNEQGRGIALKGCGGEALTDRLFELLKPKGFTRDMCEQLKENNICEILLPGAPLPKDDGQESIDASQDLAKAAASIPGTGPDMPKSMGNGDRDEDDGVLDVAKIVVSGNASEYVAKREREKAAAARKATNDANASKLVRLPNSQRAKATFQYEEFVEETGADGASRPTKRKREVTVGTERLLAATPLESGPNDRCGYSILDTLAAQIHQTILSVPDASKRSGLWDSLIILGSGSKINGFPQALLSVISQQYVLSPSSGTIFTSEIPSSFSTPLPTGGTNTPAQMAGPLQNPAAHGVNPLLVAATHGNNAAAPNYLNPNAAVAAMADPNPATHHKSTGHSQTPTSIKLLKPPEYFPEWKEQNNGGNGGGGGGGAATPAKDSAKGGASGGGNATTGVASGSNNVGMEEAMFLGAQVAAKVVFITDPSPNKSFLSRVEYNEAGPAAIHEYSL